MIALSFAALLALGVVFFAGVFAGKVYAREATDAAFDRGYEMGFADGAPETETLRSET